MSDIICADVVCRNLAKRHDDVRRLACDRINAVLKDAQQLPVSFPLSFLGEIPLVRDDLLRLLGERGWVVSLQSDPPAKPEEEVPIELASIVILKPKRPF